MNSNSWADDLNCLEPATACDDVLPKPSNDVKVRLQDWQQASNAHAGICNYLQTDSSDCDDDEVHVDRVYERRMNVYKMNRKQRDLMKYLEGGCSCSEGAQTDILSACGSIKRPAAPSAAVMSHESPQLEL